MHGAIRSLNDQYQHTWCWQDLSNNQYLSVQASCWVFGFNQTSRRTDHGDYEKAIVCLKFLTDKHSSIHPQTESDCCHTEACTYYCKHLGCHSLGLGCRIKSIAQQGRELRNCWRCHDCDYALSTLKSFGSRRSWYGFLWSRSGMTGCGINTMLREDSPRTSL